MAGPKTTEADGRLIEIYGVGIEIEESIFELVLKFFRVQIRQSWACMRTRIRRSRMTGGLNRGNVEELIGVAL
jgi:hypothetical protein